MGLLKTDARPFEFNAALVQDVRTAVIQLSDRESPEVRELNTSLIAKASSGDPDAKKFIMEKVHFVLEDMFPNYKGTDEMDDMAREVYAYNWGLGPLDKYDTDDVDELMINGTRISVERRGKITELPEKFKNWQEAMNVIRRALEHDGSTDVNEQNPIVYAERADGARITVAIPPASKEPTMNIRKFSSFVPTTENLLKVGTITPEIAQFIKLIVEGKANLIVLGEMGSGKTTFMTWILGFMKPDERIGLLETVFEVNPERYYPKHFFVQLRECPVASLDAEFRELLRANVKRILVGEMRSGKDLQNYKMGCTRGQPGCVGTFHSSSAVQFVSDAADLLINEEPTSNKHQQELGIATAVDIVLRFRKFSDGRRVCVDINELVRNGDSFYANEIFRYDFDEENPTAPGQHIAVNRLTNRLLLLLQERGELSTSYMRRMLGYGPGEGRDI